MAESEIIDIIKRYLAALPAKGIHPTHAILFGSYARGNFHGWSDIDVLVVAPEFDEQRPIPLELVTRLWTTARETDLRLQAIPCGVVEWQQPHARPVLSYAEAEGFEIAA